jgi:segregation and condensation protein B
MSGGDVLELPRAVGTEAGEGLEPWARCQAVLFAVGREMGLRDLAQAAEIRGADLNEALEQLADRLYGHGLMLQRHRETVQLVTRPEAAQAVKRALQPESLNRLSPAAYETLAIIAYRQPVTMAVVESIRGVSCERVVANLETKALVEEVGRLEAPGHPRLFGTTMRFLQLLGIASLQELPQVEGLQAPPP